MKLVDSMTEIKRVSNYQSESCLIITDMMYLPELLTIQVDTSIFKNLKKVDATISI